MNGMHKQQPLAEEIRSVDSLKGKKPPQGSKIYKQLSAIYKPGFDYWLRSFHLVPSWETHIDCLEPHIWHGYRPNPSSLIYCLKSAFYPSNETLNSWTHFVPLLIMLHRITKIYWLLERPFEKITYPFWVNSFGVCGILLASSFAHLFCCYSATGQEFCFCLDYGMIPVYGISCLIALDHYVCPFHCFAFTLEHVPRIHIYLATFVTLIGSYFTCMSRYPSCPKKYLCRFGPYAFIFILFSYPCYNRYFFKKFLLGEGQIPLECELGKDSFALFQLMGFFYLLAVIIVGFRVPEALYAGAFDIIGHSHQIFHICIASGMYFQHVIVKNALFEAIKLRDAKLIKEESLHITFQSTFGPLFPFFIFFPFFLSKTANDVGRIIEDERKKRR